MPVINFTLAEYREFKALYEQAVAKHALYFCYQGAAIFTSYGKYMLEHLAQTFEAQP